MNTKLKAALITAGIVIGFVVIIILCTIGFIYYPNASFFVFFLIVFSFIIKMIYEIVKNEIN